MTPRLEWKGEEVADGAVFRLMCGSHHLATFQIWIVEQSSGAIFLKDDLMYLAPASTRAYLDGVAVPPLSWRPPDPRLDHPITFSWKPFPWADRLSDRPRGEIAAIDALWIPSDEPDQS